MERFEEGDKEKWKDNRVVVGLQVFESEKPQKVRGRLGLNDPQGEYVIVPPGIQWVFSALDSSTGR